MKMSELKFKHMMKGSHAKISKDNVQLPASAVQPSVVDKIKRPYADEAFNTPVIITVHSFRYRGDTDGPIFKWTLDAIVESGLLADDTTKEVSEIRYKTTIIKKPKIEKTVITLQEIE